MLVSVGISKKEMTHSSQSANMSTSPKNKYSTQGPQPNNLKSEIYLSSAKRQELDESDSQMSASFSSKYFNKEDDCETNREAMNNLAPGIVNYTESVVSSTVLSSHPNGSK